MTSDLNMSHGKLFDFVSFPLFGLTLVIKIFNIFYQKNTISDLNMSRQQRLICFDLIWQ